VGKRSSVRNVSKIQVQLEEDGGGGPSQLDGEKWSVASAALGSGKI